ncbi:MAG: HAD family hydrolase [Desulfurococcales archaeon]|nr:HAD family hydrolase [Desulfurococcales archaeon]
MTNINSEAILVIVPASGNEARMHFYKTVKRPWNINDIIELKVALPDKLIEKLRKVGKFAIWGSTPRVRGIESLFEELEKGSEGFVAFYQDGKIVCWGHIFAWTRNAELAERLWGRDRRGDTWEYVYFISDLRCARHGIPWSVVRDKLGYSRDFLPRGHTFARMDRLISIIKEYGDVLSFFDSLVKSSKDYVQQDEDEKLRQKYNPYLIQSLKRLDPRILLAVIGRVSWRLRELSTEEFSKDFIISVLDEILKELGHNNVNIVSSKQYPLLVNDLRRLGIIQAGDPLDEWPSDVKASPTPLLYRIASTIEYCRHTCTDADKDKCDIIGAAIGITSLLEGVSAGSPSLHKVLTQIYSGEPLDNIAEDVASNIGASKDRVLKVLSEMKKLVEEAISIVASTDNSNCIPRLYIPLGIRRSTERVQQGA